MDCEVFFFIARPVKNPPRISPAPSCAADTKSHTKRVEAKQTHFLPQKNVLFLLEEKLVARKIKKEENIFSAGHASEASGGEADSFTDFGNRF